MLAGRPPCVADSAGGTIGQESESTMRPEAAIPNRPIEDGPALCSVVENIVGIGNLAIIGVAAMLTLGNAVQPKFNLAWSLMGAVLGAALQGWQTRRTSRK